MKTEKPTCEDVRLDFSGIAAFQNIYKILREDKEPSEEQWSELEHSPGYKVLLENDFSDIGFRYLFKLAFMPSRSQELAKKRKSNKNAGFHLAMDHYTNWVIPNFDKFESLKQKFQSNLNFCSAKDIALKYLPQNHYKYGEPSFSVVIFMPDARGYSPIVLDLSNIEKFSEKSFKLLIAHETHHFYRDQLIKWQDEKQPEVNRALIWALGQLQAEGIADLIDKKHALSDKKREKHYDLFEKYLSEVDRHISGLDEVIIGVSNNKADESKIWSQIQKAIPMAGHPTGYYMSNQILKTLGKDAVVKNVENPFHFLLTYQKVASIENLPKFSKKSISYLRQLEENLMRSVD